MKIIEKDIKSVWITGNKKFCYYIVEHDHIKLRYSSDPIDWELLIIRENNKIKVKNEIFFGNAEVKIYAGSNEECQELINYFKDNGFDIKNQTNGFRDNKVLLDPLTLNSFIGFYGVKLSQLSCFYLIINKTNLQKFIDSIIDLSRCGYKTIYEGDKGRIIM